MKLNNDKWNWSQCVNKIPCERGTEHIGKTGRPLDVRIRECKYNLKQEHFYKSKLVSHAFEEGQKFDCSHVCAL